MQTSISTDYGIEIRGLGRMCSMVVSADDSRNWMTRFDTVGQFDSRVLSVDADKKKQADGLEPRWPPGLRDATSDYCIQAYSGKCQFGI